MDGDDDDATLQNHTKSYRNYIFVDAKFSQTLKHWYILSRVSVRGTLSDAHYEIARTQVETLNSTL